MKNSHIGRFVLLFLIVSVLLMSCGEVVPPPVGDSRKSAPAPIGQAGEDAILRRPDKIGDPKEYENVTDNEEPPEDPKETRLSFVAVGDNILHSAIIEDGAAHAERGQDYAFDYIYENVRDVIVKADIAFVNQETPMGGKELGYYGYPNFNGPQEAGDALVRTGFDIVCIATNHMADVKAAGLRGTIDYWNKQKVTMIGGFLNAEDYETVRVHEKNGVKIALLAYTYGTNGMQVETSSGLVIPYINEEDIRRQVEKAKELGDLVFVNMHWGTDSSFDVTADQKKYAKLLCDLGVDVVIGEHPHVLQPMEWMTGKDGNKTLITYSIGNFLSTMYNDYFMVGGMLSFDIVKNEEGTHIENPYLIPTMTYYDMNRANLSIYFLEDVTAELVSSHGCNVHGVTSPSVMRSYVTKAIPEEFLTESFKALNGN